MVVVNVINVSMNFFKDLDSFISESVGFTCSKIPTTVQITTGKVKIPDRIISRIAITTEKEVASVTLEILAPPRRFIEVKQGRRTVSNSFKSSTEPSVIDITPFIRSSREIAHITVKTKHCIVLTAPLSLILANTVYIKIKTAIALNVLRCLSAAFFK
jgi:hypothetical protein